MTASHKGSAANVGKPWLNSDVLFLQLAIKRGMSVAAVAAFLGREEKEVRQKGCEELRSPRRANRTSGHS
jgi:hypothetical protein